MSSRTPRVIALLALIIGAMALSASAASATPLTVNGGWQTFAYGSGLGPVASNLTFSSNKPTRLEITDYGCAGDQFSAKDGSKKLGNTNSVLVTPGGISCFTYHPYANTPDDGWASKQFSHGTWTFVAGGSHSINVSVLANPFGGGAGAIRVDTIKK